MNLTKAAILRYLLPILIFAVTVAAFWPVLQNEFVDWDDLANLTMNPHYRGLGWTQLRWMFTTFWLGHYQPLSWVTLASDYLVWGMNPFGYHLTSLMLHGVNALVFYYVAARLLCLALRMPSDEISVRLGAALAAILFAIHPLRVESVAWVTERRDVVSGLFFLLTILWYLRANTAGEKESYRTWMVLSLVAYLMSLLSKAVGMTLPVVLCVLDVYPLRRMELKDKWFGMENRKVWLEKTPFVALALGAAVVAAMAQTGAIRPLGSHGLVARVAQASFGFLYYLRKTILPIALSPMYELPANFTPWQWIYVMSGLVVVGLTIALVILRRYWPAGLAIWVYYLALVAPVSGIAQAGPQLVADRYSYLSCLGWALLASYGMVYSWQRWLNERAIRMAMGAAAVVLVIAGLGVLTWHQAQVWHDSEKLYRFVLNVTPDSKIAHNNLGSLLALKGRINEATVHYRRAIQLDPSQEEFHNNLAEALVRQGQLDEAAVQYREALKLKPNFATAHYALGQLLVKQGKMDEASEQYRQAIKSNPSYIAAYNNLGYILFAKGQVDEAIDNYRRALQLEPNLALIHVNLGNALFYKGQVEEAITHYRRALEADSKRASTHFYLGNALALRGEVDDSIAHYRRAIELDSNFAAAHAKLADLLFDRGKIDDAINQFRSALAIDGSSATVHYNFANALMRKGRLAEAIDHYQRAQKADPKFAEAYYALGNAYFKKAEIVKDAIFYGDAIDQYQIAIKLNPKYVDAHYNYGNAAMRVADFETAADQYQKALEYDKKSVKILTNLAAALASLGYNDEAALRYQVALQLNPNYADAHYNWGNLLLNKGDIVGAIERYRRAIKINPKSVEAHTNLASALKAEGDQEGALKHYQEALNINPRFAEAHFNLGLLKADMGDVDAALGHFRQAVEINPMDVDAYYYWGKLLMAIGRLEEAAARFNQALRLAPDFEAAKSSLKQLADLQAQKNDTGQGPRASGSQPESNEGSTPR